MFYIPMSVELYMEHFEITIRFLERYIIMIIRIYMYGGLITHLYRMPLQIQDSYFKSLPVIMLTCYFCFVQAIIIVVSVAFIQVCITLDRV